MNKLVLSFAMSLMYVVTFSQAGHIMQGVGAVNMSMGGAATAQPLDISGAIHWNPAAISVFDEKIIKLDVGFFFSAPEVSSSLPEGMLGPGAPGVSGTTVDDRGMSPLPAIAMVWGREDSKHTFAASVFGVSGFGVTFPEEANNPLSPEFNPMNNSNPINYPQAAMGFGFIESDYLMVQGGFTWAYELSESFSVGVQPTFNFASLELTPNPTANPNPSAGYPVDVDANAFGFGGQIGVFYQTEFGLNLGVSYKTPQWFGEFTFENTYLDGSEGENNFTMNYPGIASVGLGYSKGKFDLALDYRHVNYSNTDGFSEAGWTQTAAVAGFGWESISIISAGIQFSGINRLPIRIGYTYSSNPISSEMAFFNVPATAIIKNAFQIGLSYEVGDRFVIDLGYHRGMSGDPTSGEMYNPQLIQPEGNPHGAIPGSSISYEMTTDLAMLGLSYRFVKK